MFGMHPNAEIGSLTLQCEDLFDTILNVEGGSSGSSSSQDDQIMAIILDLKARAPSDFSMLEITSKIKTPEEKTPYVVVALQ